MKIFYTAILLFSVFKSIYAQENLKKIIYEDLFTLNEIYNNCIINYEQKRIIIKDKDTVKYFETVNTIRQDLNKVILVKIDSINNFYFVEARFDLIPNHRYVGLFSNNTFDFILYRTGSQYYKINGFFVSEILLPDCQTEFIKNLSRRIEIPRKFNKYLIKRDIEKIRKYLSVSVLAKINQLGFQFNYRPYVKDIICY